MFNPKLSSSLCLLCMLVLMGLQYSCSRPTHSKAIEYLVKYGYLAKRCHATIGNSALKKAVRMFQKMAGICTTGNIDMATMEAMALPRCGNKDGLKTETAIRQKRYTLHGSKWRNTNITFKVDTFTHDLNVNETEATLQQSLYMWNSVSSLSITKSNSTSSNIVVKFVKGDHEDDDPFEGAGGALAHAFFPVYGGDVHFDDDETWTLETTRGINLFQIATHEFGHSLGLGHSEVMNAVMNPLYRGYNPSFKLHLDDILAIQSLYGPNTNKK